MCNAIQKIAKQKNKLAENVLELSHQPMNTIFALIECKDGSRMFSKTKIVRIEK